MVLAGLRDLAAAGAAVLVDDVDPVVHALLPLVAGLDRDDERTAGVVDAIEGLFLKLKQSSVRTCVAGSPRGPGGREVAPTCSDADLPSSAGRTPAPDPVPHAARSIARRDGARFAGPAHLPVRARLQGRRRPRGGAPAGRRGPPDARRPGAVHDAREHEGPRRARAETHVLDGACPRLRRPLGYSPARGRGAVLYLACRVGSVGVPDAHRRHLPPPCVRPELRGGRGDGGPRLERAQHGQAVARERRRLPGRPPPGEVLRWARLRTCASASGHCVRND